MTMVQATDHSQRHYIPSRSELSSPDNDWEKSWHLARLPGLGSEMTSFLWKLLHKLLPTQDRLARIAKNKSSLCQLCTATQEENLEHALLNCEFNNGAGTILMKFLKKYMPRLTSSQALLLALDVDASLEFPVVWVISNFLSNIWNFRSEKKQVRLYKIRADLESRASLLRETRYLNEGQIILEMLQSIFL